MPSIYNSLIGFTAIMSFAQDLKADKERFLARRLKGEKSACGRLSEHSFISKLALKYVLLYGLENDIISKTAAEKIMNKLSAQIDAAAELQKKIMRYIAKKSGENTMRPAKALYDALQAGDIRPDGENCFTSVTDNVEFLWIRSDKLTFELNRIYGFEYTSQKYIKYFRRKEILALDKSGEKSTKRHNGRRYLVLRLDILQEVAESIYEDVDALLS